MGYAVKFTGSNMDQILEKSKNFKSHNEDWVIIPSSIKTLNINSLFRTGNYAYSGTISLPDMEQLYGFNTATAQSATTIDCDCIIFVRNINHNIYQFICMHGIHDADDKIMGIVWIHNTPKVFYVNEISNTLMAIAEDESSDKGLLKFDNQIRFFNVTKNLKYYDETDHTYKVLTGVIDNMDKSIYGDISDVFTMVDNNIDIDINALNDHMNDETIHVTAEEKADYDNKYTSTDLNSDVDAFMKSNSWDNFNTGIDTINANILSIIDTNKTASKELNTHTPGWNLITSEVIMWYSVCYGNDKFVAVGFNPNNSYGKIQYSTDGIVWIDCTPVDKLFPLTSVYYGNGIFIATSVMESTSYIIESTDGINWEPIQISETNNAHQAICYGNDKFVVVANNSNYFAYSTDGINWTENTISSTSRGWISVCYGNDKYIILSQDGYMAYSTDGITWTEAAVGSSDSQWWQICYGNNLFVAITLQNSNYLYSTDGITWTEGTVEMGVFSVCYGNGYFVLSGVTNYNKFAYSTDGITWTYVNTEEKHLLPSICYGVDKYLAVGFYPGNPPASAMMYSMNLTEWKTTNKSVDFSGNFYSICHGDNGFIAVRDSSNLCLYSTDGINWIASTISSTSREWRSVCYGNKKYVAVASSTNYFAYSTDGITWTESTISSTSREWWSVCYGNGKFVTVSWSNYFAYSTDGIIWTESTISDTSIDWYSVCYGNGKFVTVADGNYFAYSTDGITWTESTISNTSRLWRSVCYGNGMFVAVAYRSNYFAYSTDGINWTEGKISSTSREWFSICYGNDKFVAVAYRSNYFAYSTDGINWTESTISNTSRFWKSVCYGNDKFVAVTDGDLIIAYEYEYAMPEIENRLNPIMDDNIYTVCYGNDKFVAVGANGTAAYSIDGNTWTPTTVSTTTQNWYSVCYGNGKFVAISGSFFNTSQAFAYSTDGINWTEGAISDTARNWFAICYGNGMFVTVSWSNYFAYSTDGINWTEGTISNTSRQWISVCYGNDKFITVALNSNYFAYSMDGIHWTESTISSTRRFWMSVCYGNDKFVAVGNSNYFAYSTDGIHWTEGTISDNAVSNGIWSMCYGNGRFIAVSGGELGPSTYYAYSTDGINWTEGNLISIEKTWTSICYGNDKYIIVNAEGSCTYLTEEDFNSSSSTTEELLHPTDDQISSWNSKADKGHTHILDNRVKVDASDVIGNITIDQIPEEAKERMITVNSISDMLKLTKNDAHEGTWVFVTETNTSKLFVVKDLTTWTESTSPSNRLWDSVCYGNDKFVTVAYNSKYFAYSTDGIHWTQGSIGYTRYWQSVCYGNGKFVAIAKNTNYYAYSSNGTSWTRGTLPSSRYWRSVCYGNGKFVTVASGTNYFAYSTNGINWTESKISNTSRSWMSICYGNDKFVAVASNTNYFAYSTDGINWTESTISSTGRAWQSVCYGNGKFVAVTYNTNYFAYSTDGINWTEGTISSNNIQWQSVCYGNGKFVAVASGNYFAYGNPCLSLDNFTQLTISPNITWGDLANKPTTFDELGITDSISNTEVDTLVSNLSTPAASAQTAVDTTSEKYSILTDDLIANTHKIETDIDDSDQKLNALYDILTMPDEIVTTLKSLMT